MRKGQTSIRNGIQDVLYPMPHMRLTQGDNVGTHKGTYAIDDAGRDGGKDFAYFPVDMESVYLDTVANGNAVFWQSLKPVRFADGSIDYLTMLVIHDDDPTGTAKGNRYRQGIQMAQEGTAGNATGNHLHFEFAKGKHQYGKTLKGNTSVYNQNKHGVWHLKNNMPVEDVCFMDGTEIIGGRADWKYLTDVPVKDKPTTKPPTSKPPVNKPDQILHPGEKFKFDEVYRVEAMKRFNGKWAVYNKRLKAYITVGIVNKVDKNGVKTANQVLYNGDYFVVPGTYIVEKVVGNTIYPKNWGFGVDAKTLLEV